MKKELCSPYSKLIKGLIKTFNIPTDCRKFVLTCEVNELVTLDISRYVQVTDENGNDIQNQITETFHLVKKEDD